MNIHDALQSGRLANLDAVAAISEAELTRGNGAGMRVIDVAVCNGISVRIYPDRGLDLGQAWFQGIPLAWISTTGETKPLKYLEGMRWSSAFIGGLMTTSGLRNVGMPSEGHGLHGTYSHLAAQDVDARRTVTPEGAKVEVTGVVTDPAQPGPLRHRRSIVVHAGSGRIELADATENLGDEAAAVPLLYHFNFGAPLWAPPATLDMPVHATRARDPASEAAIDTWRQPPPVTESSERVLEHDLGEAPVGRAVLENTQIGLRLTISWDRTALPRLNQWIDPNPGMSVLGIEPANCGTRGRAFERNALTLPTLPPGETRRTRLTVDVESVSGRASSE